MLPVQDKKLNPPFCRPGLMFHSRQIDNFDPDSWVPRWFSSHNIELPADAEKNPLLHSLCKVVIARELQTEYFLKDFGVGCKETIAAMDGQVRGGKRHFNAVPFGEARL